MNEELDFREMCVNPSCSGDADAVSDTVLGRVSVSCNGRRNDVNLNPVLAVDEDDFMGVCSTLLLVGALIVRSGVTTPLRVTVVSSTSFGDPRSGRIRCARTASRIWSSAAGRSWKYAKKYESTEYCSSLSRTFTSIVSLKSIAEDFSTSSIAE